MIILFSVLGLPVHVQYSVHVCDFFDSIMYFLYIFHLLRMRHLKKKTAIRLSKPTFIRLMNSISPLANMMPDFHLTLSHYQQQSLHIFALLKHATLI